MIAPSYKLSCTSGANPTLLRPLKHSKRTLRTSLMQKSRLYRMTRLVNTCQLLSHKFMDQCGIARRHSTRNRPQQNGVAERANRTISDHVTAMLNEAKLPASFWALAVTAYVHVWNRLPYCAPARYNSLYSVVQAKTRHLSLQGVWVHCLCLYPAR